MREFLKMVYYLILNIHPYSQGKNFLGNSNSHLINLEHQALTKLVNETLALVKTILDLMSEKKKEQSS